MKAPDFNLPDSNGKSHSLSDYKGKWIVLYFYPKDNTPGCTKEACNFRDNIKDFEDLNTVIIGISADSTSSHKKFTENYELNFTLLSDKSKSTIKAYNSLGMKKFMGREFEGILRNTFLINPEGEIVKEYDSVDPASHFKEVLADLKQKTL